MSFPRVPVVPHIHWVTFHGGISQLVSSKSTSEKSNNTPSAGGHRSADFLILLIMLYFAIDNDGDIIPIENNFRYNGIKIGNINKLFRNAIYSMLDMYFILKRERVYLQLK